MTCQDLLENIRGSHIFWFVLYSGTSYDRREVDFGILNLILTRILLDI